jgi:hypothetical protein
MEENAVYLVLGAAGAVVATLLLLILDDLWMHRLGPLWRRWRYRGVNISGGWKGLGNASTPVPGEWTEVGLSLEQQVRELRGLLWIRRCSAQRSLELRVPLSGSIAEGYVTLAGSPADGSEDAPAAALLTIDARGACLTGQLLYRDAHTDAVEAIQMSVYRASTMALPRLRPLLGVQAAIGDAA